MLQPVEVNLGQVNGPMRDTVMIRRLFVALVAFGLWGIQLEAQGLEEVDQPSRGVFGINGTLARPIGEFQNFVGWGGGLSMYGLVNFQRGGPLGIRFDASVVSYGHESQRRPLSSTIQRVTIDVDTDNLIASFGVGPQVTIGHGRLRPYAYGTVGVSYFATVSKASGLSDTEAFASSTNFDDFAAALSGGAGLLFRVSGGKNPVSLDVSARTLYNGRVSYLRKGSILESADGSISFIPIRSDANFVTFRLGIAVGV